MANDVRVRFGPAMTPAVPEHDETGVFRRDDPRWSLDAATAPVPARCLDGRPFPTAEREWKGCCPARAGTASVADLAVADLHLWFSVSRDEEYVQLQVTCGAATFDLGARSRHYLLLTLARRRLEDTAQGLPETTCGWVHQEELEHDPSMAPPQLNVDVFRIRKQFAAFGVVDSTNVVERRLRARQLRIGTGRVTIARL